MALRISNSFKIDFTNLTNTREKLDLSYLKVEVLLSKTPAAFIGKLFPQMEFQNARTRPSLARKNRAIRRSVVWGLLASLSLSLVLILWYFAGRTHFELAPIHSSSSLPSTSLLNEAANVITASSTQGWKMYQDTQYGFEFLYPARTVVERQDHGGTVGLWSNSTFLEEFLVYEPARDETQGGFFQIINVYTKSGSESLRAWFNKEIDFQGKVVETSTNGFSGLDVRGGGSDGFGILNAVFLLNKNLIVEIDRSGSFVTDEFTPDQERLFESFRFTN